tara:strand:+ start:28 stop:549 length:522 start_codon:yes stop_codon:yes gene_type:complete
MSGIISDNLSKSSGLIKSAGGGGKIGQVIQTVKTDTTTYASASFADISGMSVAITPAATSSKILVMSDIYPSGTGGYGIHIKLLRDSTDIYIGDAASSRSRATKGAVHYRAASNFQMAFHYLDSPSTTSEVTYKLQWYPESSATVAIGRSQGDGDAVYNSRTANTITVMEVLA